MIPLSGFDDHQSGASARAANSGQRGSRRGGLASASCTDALTPGVLMKAIHITELRSNLDAARPALGLPAIPYTDRDMIKAAHIQELRPGVK